MAAGASTAHDPRLGASAVLVDCLALLGPDADDGSAAKCVEFIAWVFERCVLCGFGVAADVRKLLASYPDRFEKRFSGISVRTVCVRDIAVGLGVDEVKVRGLASMCALCLGGRELDKSRQKSDWGARPLSDAQISYAALDALAPAMILRRLLASRSTVVGSNPIGGDTCGVYLNVGKTCGTWVRTETWERTALARIEGLERKGPRGPKLNPLTTVDVAAALEAAGGAARGIRIEDWNDVDGVDSHPGVTLCKSLGFVAESPGGAKKVLAVCVLPATGGVVVDARAVTSLLFGSEVNTNAASCRLATPAELVDEFGYERGCMGPLGLRRGVESFTVVFDSSLTTDGGDNTVAVGAGATGVKATGSVAALVEITGAIVADISRPRRHH
jgi:prolyl-tRNA editing enzyme YbaK/EbsC (Cys-tRNA(Pro) deacylase)